MTGNRQAGLAAKLLLGLFPVLAVGQDGPADGGELARAKGIFLTKEPGIALRQAARFFVLLPVGLERVSPLHRFYSGDQLKFQFELKHPAYVYVLNSTIPGDESARVVTASEKGIVNVRQSKLLYPPIAVDPWHILLPEQPGEPTRVAAGVTTDAARFKMDDEAGLELVTVIVSPTPIDIARMVESDYTADDSREDAITNGQAGSLAAWRANCVVSLSPDSASPPRAGSAANPNDGESYAIARDANRPFAFQIALHHLPQQLQ